MRKQHALAKDIAREVWRTKARFLSIFAIIALGVGFFAGLKSVSPDMLETAQVYFEEQNLTDLHIVSTYGLNEDDIEALAEYEGTDSVQGGYSIDAFVSVSEDRDVIVRAYSYDMQTIGSEKTPINEFVLTEGRYPENETECLVDNGELNQGNFVLGQEITLFRSDDTIDENMTNETFTIVGFIYSPQYISFERGSTSLGSGVINNYVYIPKEAFSYEVYTDAYVTLNTTNGIPFYDENYETTVETAIDELEVIAEERSAARYQEIYDEAKAELDDGLAEWQDAQDDYKQGLKDVANGWDSYYSGINQLEDAEAELKAKRQEVADARSDLSDLIELRTHVGDTVTSFASAVIPLPAPLGDDLTLLVQSSSAFNQILGGGTQFEVLFENYIRTDPSDPNKAILEGQLNGMLSGIDVYIREVDAQLDDAEIQMSDGEEEITSGYAELRSAKADLLDAEQELKDAKIELDDAKEEIDDGYAELEDLEEPEWYLFDRDSFPAYSGYQDNADRVDQIASVFPVFFILVAMLVCLTTMTRMVEEQRTEIGTLKALGYNKPQIIAKYLIYATTASLVGSIVGLLIGFQVFPHVVYNAYGIMYILPDLIAPFRWDYAIMTTAVAVFVTNMAAFIAAFRTLHSVPAELMRPKPPKTGKRVLIEKIGFIWKRMGFLQKVTIRNLFRYKRRILMTVIGIAGCTALLLAGLGMRDAVSSVVSKQYEDIFVYDGFMIYDDTADAEDLSDMLITIDEQQSIENKLQLRLALTDATVGSEAKTTYLFVAQDPSELSNYINLQDRVGREQVTLDDNGVVVTEKLSKLLELSPGDTITLETDTNVWTDFTVSGITENYAMNYVYISDSYYTEIVGENPVYNGFMFNMTATDDETETALSTALVDNDSILTVTFTSDTLVDFSDTMDSLDYVILMIVFCAGALAFIVLYNLANINVQERIREIATIKVLGFYDMEVSKYVNRENTISAVIGMLFGLLLGVPLEQFIIKTAEVDNLMFVPTITPMSFVYSMLLTIGFTVIVNLALHHTLRKVDMIESLKSIE